MNYSTDFVPYCLLLFTVLFLQKMFWGSPKKKKEYKKCLIKLSEC